MINDATEYIDTILNKDNGEDEEPEEPGDQPAEYTDIYVTAYSDGTLSFSSTDAKIPDKTVADELGNIKGRKFTVTVDLETPSISVDTPWYKNSQYITSVVFLDEIVPSSVTGWFANCTSLTSIEGLEYLNTERITDMSYMFIACAYLDFEKIDFSVLNTSNVENMSLMFSFLSWGDITELDLSKLDTSNVTNMQRMFYMSTNLESINLSGSFDTSNVTDMSWMFAVDNDTMALTEIIGLDSFNTSNVTNMQGMFQNCSFTSLDLTSFDTRKVTDMSYMFCSCTSLTNVYVSCSTWVTADNNEYMFYYSGLSNVTPV